MLQFGGFGRRTSPSAPADQFHVVRGGGLRKPAAATVSLLIFGTFLAAALTACAVGPDFRPPPAPPVSGYTPEARLAGTAAVDVAAGASQKFDTGRDIPAEWWKVFHSHELDALITEALLSNPNLEAAQAALWQAKENLYAQAGALLPTADLPASGDAPAILTRGIRRHRSAVEIQSVPGQRQRLLCARRFRRHAPADRGERGDRRLSAFRTGSGLSHADLERGDGGRCRGVAARPDRGDARHHQDRERPARGRAPSIRRRRRRPHRRADAAIRSRDRAGDAAAAAEATGAAAPRHPGADRTLPQRNRARSFHFRIVAVADAIFR